MNSPTQYRSPFLCSVGGVAKQWRVLEQLEERIVLDGTLDDAYDVQDLGADGGHTDKLGWTYIDNGWWKENNDSGWWWERATDWYWNELTGWWKLDSGNFTYWYHGEHQYWANEISTNAWFWWDDVTDHIWEPAFTWFADQVDSEWMWVCNDWNGTEYYADDLHSLYQDHNGNAWYWFDAINDAVWESYRTWFVDGSDVQVFNDYYSSEYIWGNGFHYSQQHESSYVNDAPVVLVPDPQTVAEDSNLTIPGIHVYDVDAGTSPLQVTLSVDHGLLTLSTIAGIDFVFGDGTEDGVMEFQGTWNELNTVLQSILYLPTENFDSSDVLSVVVNDLGYSGSGGPQSVSESVGITVSPVNDAPYTDPIPASVLVEDFGTSDYDVSSYFHDVDSILSYRFGSIFYAGGLALADLSIDPGTGVVTFASALNSNGSMDIEVIGSDGQYETTRTFTLTVNAVNDSPVNSVPLETQTFLDSLTFGADYSNQISVGDPDAGTIQSRSLSARPTETSWSDLPLPVSQ